MWTVASWTLRPSRRYGFAVCVFAIEVRLAAFFVGKVTAALECNSFFAFAAWLSRRTLTTLTAFAALT
jgi:hypothetical protein